MSAKSLFLYTLSLALGIGAVTHAKSELIEQGPQPQEAAQTAKSYRHGGVQHGRYQMTPSFIPHGYRWPHRTNVSYAPNQWHRWTA